VAGWTARHFATTAGLARRAFVARGLAPRRFGPLPAPAPALPRTAAGGAAAIYFPSCLTRTMGAIPGETNARDTAAAFVAVAARAGLPLHIPEGVERCCCGTPFSSKGFIDAHVVAVNATIELLWAASREGALPVIVDTSPCAFGLKGREALSAGNRERAARMRVVDAIEFFAADVAPRLTVLRRLSGVTLHPVCSTVKMGIVPQLVSILRRCSEDVFIPPSTGCCGFAGDRGWLVPELTASATAAAAAEVRNMPAEGWYSSSRTCEIALARATGHAYRSWIHLLDWATDHRLIEQSTHRAIESDIDNR
jgi:D-lactate dehydrogenase